MDVKLIAIVTDGAGTCQLERYSFTKQELISQMENNKQSKSQAINCFKNDIQDDWQRRHWNCVVFTDEEALILGKKLSFNFNAQLHLTKVNNTDGKEESLLVITSEEKASVGDFAFDDAREFGLSEYPEVFLVTEKTLLYAQKECEKVLATNLSKITPKSLISKKDQQFINDYNNLHGKLPLCKVRLYEEGDIAVNTEGEKIGTPMLSDVDNDNTFNKVIVTFNNTL